MNSRGWKQVARKRKWLVGWMLSADSSFFNIESLARVDFVKYLEITIDTNLRWSLQTSGFVKILRRLSFYIKILRDFQVKQHSSSFAFEFLTRCPLFFPCHFFNLSKKEFMTGRRDFPITSDVSYISRKEFCTKLCVMHPSACGLFAHEIILDPSHSSHDYLSKCCIHTRTRSAFHFVPCCINIQKDIDYFISSSNPS